MRTSMSFFSRLAGGLLGGYMLALATVVSAQGLMPGGTANPGASGTPGGSPVAPPMPGKGEPTDTQTKSPTNPTVPTDSAGSPSVPATPSDSRSKKKKAPKPDKNRDAVRDGSARTTP